MNITEENRNVGEFIGSAFISFTATNIDDLVILMNFFTEASLANVAMKVHHIFIGQYLGFILILCLSLVGYALSYAVPVEMLGFLGFFPIGLGIKGIIELIQSEYRKHYQRSINNIIPNDHLSTIELEAIRYQNGHIINRQEPSTELSTHDDDASSPKHCKQKLVKFFSHCLNIQTLKIISITIANSGDNVAIYTPLFAQAYQWQIAVYISIYLVMLSVWLVFSYYFINFRPILNLAQKFARFIVPIVFVAIGIYILITSDCFLWLQRAITTKNFRNG